MIGALPITTAADDIHKYFFIIFSEKIRLDVSSESSARQGIHIKIQALFSSKDKSKKLKCRLLQFLVRRFKGLECKDVVVQRHKQLSSFEKTRRTKQVGVPIHLKIGSLLSFMCSFL